MKCRKIAAICLAAAMAVPATGCTSFNDWFSNFLVEYDKMYSDDPMPRTTINEENATTYVENPTLVFNHMSFSEPMFYGKYIVDGTVNTEMNDEAKQAFIENSNTFSMTASHARLTVMPYRMDLGPHCNVTPLNYLSGYEWALLYFYDKQGNSVQVPAAYSVEGNLLRMQLVKDYNYDSEKGTLDYAFSGDTLKYYYSFTTDGLVLSNSDGKVIMHPEDLTGETPEINVFDANLAEGSEKLDGIDSINLTTDEQYVMVDGIKCPVTGYELSENGIFKLKWSAGGVDHEVQTVYLYNDDDGITLVDSENVYSYNLRSNDLYTKKVTSNISVSDSETLQGMSADDITAIQNRVSELYDDLEAAFAENGVEAVIDRDTGEIALNSVVLFTVDSYFITSEGQLILTNFLKAYTSVIFNEKYDGFVSQIEIEGHTDPTGLAYHNEVLSQARADEVKNFCLSTDSGMDALRIAKLEPMLTSVGYASTHPIFGANGEVDLEASRRVSFHFVIDIGNAAQEQE